MFKYRYGLSWQEVIEGRKTAHRLCFVCQRLTRKDPIYFNNRRVCFKCSRVLSFLNDPQRLGLVDMCLGRVCQPIQTT